MGYGTAEMTKPRVCLYVEYPLGLSSLRAEAFKKAGFSHPTAGSSQPFADMGIYRHRFPARNPLWSLTLTLEYLQQGWVAFIS